MSLISYCLIDLTRTSSTMLNRSSERKRLLLVPDLKAKAYRFSSMMLPLSRSVVMFFLSFLFSVILVFLLFLLVYLVKVLSVLLVFSKNPFLASSSFSTVLHSLFHECPYLDEEIPFYSYFFG